MFFFADKLIIFICCGTPFDLSHALSCKKGGLVTHRHHKAHGAFGDLTALVWNQIKELVVREASTLSHTPALVADISIRGVWIPQAEALFDIIVTDTDAQSYLSSSNVITRVPSICFLLSCNT